MTSKPDGISRRDFAKSVTAAASVAALAALHTPNAHAAASSAIQLALIGCGGRGTGAALDALSTAKQGPIKLVAMADVFTDRLKGSYDQLEKHGGGNVDVPPERRFVGFNAYKQAMDCLKPGDIAICATPPGFRWVHFSYAIDKALNFFMEKPVSVDGPSAKKIMKLAELADQKGLKVGVGLMCRHCKARQALFQQIQEGAIGDLIALRAYRMHGPVGSAFTSPMPKGQNELHYQIRNFHSFLWASGGCYSDFYIHNIDESCWMKNAWPVKAQACGGRHYRGNCVDQNFDTYSVEYTFQDGAKLFLNGRTMDGCHDEFASYAHGSKGLAIISTSSHYPARCRIYKGQNIDKANLIWQFDKDEPNPYQVEWQDLVDAVRNNKPYNEAKRGAEASLVTSMGRMAAHTGQVITFDQILNSTHEFAPDIDKLGDTYPAPVQAGPDGKYPIPEPGKKKAKEY